MSSSPKGKEEADDDEPEPMAMSDNEVDGLFPDDEAEPREQVQIPRIRPQIASSPIGPVSTRQYHLLLAQMGCPQHLENTGPFPFFIISVRADEKVLMSMMLPTSVVGLVSFAFHRLCEKVLKREMFDNLDWADDLNPVDFLPWVIPKNHLFKEFCAAAKDMKIAGVQDGEDCDVVYNLVVAQNSSGTFVHYSYNGDDLETVPRWVRSARLMAESFNENGFDKERFLESTVSSDFDLNGFYSGL